MLKIYNTQAISEGPVIEVRTCINITIIILNCVNNYISSIAKINHEFAREQCQR